MDPETCMHECFDFRRKLCDLNTFTAQQKQNLLFQKKQTDVWEKKFHTKNNKERWN